MQFSGTLSSEDAHAATWLHIAPRKSMAILGLVVLALAFWALYFMFSRPGIGDNSTKWILLGAMTLIALQLFVVTPFQTKKRFESRSAHRLELTGSTSDHGLTFSNAHGSVLVPWADFTGWKENKQIILLYIAGGITYVLPKRFFTHASDIEEFRSLFASRVHKG